MQCVITGYWKHTIIRQSLIITYYCSKYTVHILEYQQHITNIYASVRLLLWSNILWYYSHSIQISVYAYSILFNSETLRIIIFAPPGSTQLWVPTSIISNLGHPIIHSGCVPSLAELSTGAFVHPVLPSTRAHVHTSTRYVMNTIGMLSLRAAVYGCVPATPLRFDTHHLWKNGTTPNNKHVSPYKTIGSWLQIILIVLPTWYWYTSTHQYTL